MSLTTIAFAIEAARHEMPTAAFLEQAALAHHNASGTGHLVLGELDRPVPLRVVEFLVPVAGDAVELQQPVLEAGPCIDLA